MTTFTELLREAKEGKKLVPRPINQDLQKHIDSLNKMFAENWSPLFDKDKDYELWSDYSNHVYFGNNYQHTLVVNKSAINTIELAPVNWLHIKRFPYSLKIMYVLVLKYMVKRKIAYEFQKAVIDSGLSAIFDKVRDLDDLIQNMNNVLGENTFVLNDNSIKFKNEFIPVENINLMRDCYHALSEELFDLITTKDYKEATSDLFNLLQRNRETHGDLIKLLLTLKNLYLDEVNSFYPREYIEAAKDKFKNLCRKYTIDSNSYLLYPLFSNEGIDWKVTLKNSPFAPDSYFSLNAWYTHKGMKNISKETFYDSLEELEDKVLNVSIKEVNNAVADKIVDKTIKKVRELNLRTNDIDKEISFNDNKISVTVKEGNLSLKYKDYTFQCSYYSPHGPKTYFDKEDKTLEKENWLDYKIKLRQVSDLFIDFLNS